MKIIFTSGGILNLTSEVSLIWGLDKLLRLCQDKRWKIMFSKWHKCFSNPKTFYKVMHCGSKNKEYDLTYLVYNVFCIIYKLQHYERHICRNWRRQQNNIYNITVLSAWADPVMVESSGALSVWSSGMCCPSAAFVGGVFSNIFCFCVKSSFLVSFTF